TARAHGRFGDPEGNVPPSRMHSEDSGHLEGPQRFDPQPHSEPEPGAPASHLPLEPWSEVTRPTAGEPRALTLEELRHELAVQLGLRPEDITPQRISETVGDLQYRNLLRAGGIEALSDVVDRFDRATAWRERERFAAARDEWARLLGVD
ncbi:hypothetical protein, partial [Nocardia sp. NPDC004722]